MEFKIIMILFIKLQELLLTNGSETGPKGFDYCTIDSCPKGEHTMCKYPSKVACEKDGVYTGLNEELRIAILDLHNHHRQNVALGKQSFQQPQAANMVKLLWHKEAERIAQRWANQCIASPDKCRNIEHFIVGQNFVTVDLGLSHPEVKGTILALINAWYDEVHDFDKEQVQSFKNMNETNHYTQMVWAETTAVGCGFLLDAPETGHRMINLFCNYVPSGNVVGKPIYKVGKACSECPEGTKCSKTYPGICTSEPTDFGDDPASVGLAIPPKASNLLIVSILICVCWPCSVSGFS